ncbi:MAG: DUF2798 domain-containing protein [Sphingopyxis sp.]|nr:DUF2798 domain-containing protein [Sphingopyxis sp.]
MSFVFIVRAHGLELQSIPIWLRAWLLGFAVAAPAGLILRPLAMAFANSITDNEGAKA